MSFIIRRLVFYVVAAWVALTINFFIPRLVPGNAVESIMSKFPNLQPSAYRAIEAMLGVGHPGSIWHQYWAYLVDVSHLDFGISSSEYPAQGHRPAPARAVHRGQPADHPGDHGAGMVRVQLAELHRLAEPAEPVRQRAAVRNEQRSRLRHR